VLDDDRAAEPGRVGRQVLGDPGASGLSQGAEQVERAVIGKLKVTVRSISFLLARDVTGRIGLGALPPFPVTRRGLAAVDDRALDADKNYNRSMLATSTMRHLGWLFLFVGAVAAMWWAGLKGIAVLVTLARIIHERSLRAAGGACRRVPPPPGPLRHPLARIAALRAADGTRGSHYARPGGGGTLRHPPGHAIAVRE
jgi:hypothetical protein